MQPSSMICSSFPPTVPPPQWIWEPFLTVELSPCVFQISQEVAANPVTHKGFGDIVGKTGRKIICICLLACKTFVVTWPLWTKLSSVHLCCVARVEQETLITNFSQHHTCRYTYFHDTFILTVLKL